MEIGNEIEKKLENISYDLGLLKKVLLRWEIDGDENMKSYSDIRLLLFKGDIEELKEEYKEEFSPLPFEPEKGKVKISIADFMSKPLNEKLVVIWINQVQHNTEIRGSFWNLKEQIKRLWVGVYISFALIWMIFLKLIFF